MRPAHRRPVRLENWPPPSNKLSALSVPGAGWKLLTARVGLRRSGRRRHRRRRPAGLRADLAFYCAPTAPLHPLPTAEGLTSSRLWALEPRPVAANHPSTPCTRCSRKRATKVSFLRISKSKVNFVAGFTAVFNSVNWPRFLTVQSCRASIPTPTFLEDPRAISDYSFRWIKN